MFDGLALAPEFQMSLLMFVALAGYLLSYAINQSAVVGIILVGIIVGPSLLGLITYTDFVEGLAHLGAVVLLFSIGLEFELKEIFKTKYGIIALIGVVLPWGVGFLLSRAFHFDFNASVFIGTALTATSIAVTANVLQEMGVLKTQAAWAIMGAAVIDDILALLALTVSEQLVSDSVQLSVVLVNIIKAAGFLLIGIFLLRPILRRNIRWFDSTRVAKKYPETIFIYAMMVAFLYSIGAEAAGLSAVVGSFLGGVTFASIRLNHGQIFREGANHLKIIFASIFFVSLGILLDIHVIDLRLAVFIIILIIVAAASKFIGCGLPARFLGYTWKDSAVIGTGMMPRGEVAMIVALIGLSRGWIAQNIYVALVLMSLLTTVLAPLLLQNWLFRKKKEQNKPAVTSLENNQDNSSTCNEQ
jgi:Kef-type K+ transport system membrane component KefB